MRHPAALVLLLLTTTALAQAPDPARRNTVCDAEIAILLDPHASVPDKFKAVRTLKAMGPAARPAALALARQSRYNIEPLRQEAMETLLALVGIEETAKLRAQVAANDPSLPAAAAAQILETVKSWDDLPRVSGFLEMPTTDMNLAGVRALLKIWEANRAPPKDGDLVLLKEIKPVLLTALFDQYTSLDKPQRRPATELAVALGIDHADGIPLLIRAMTDEDPAVNKLVNDFAARAFKAPPSPAVSPRSVVRLVDLALDNRMRPEHRPLAQQYLSSIVDKDSRALVVRECTYRVARGEFGEKALLRELPPLFRDLPAEQRRTLAHAAAIGQEPDAFHRQLLARAYDPSLKPDDVARAITSYVTGRDYGLRLKAARLAVADPSLVQPTLLIDASIEQAVDQPEDVVKLLLPDPKVAAARLAPWLKEGTLAQKRAAIAILKTTGLEGDAIKAQLTRLLDLPDEDPAAQATRLAAAELLGRTDILARVRIPQLIADLRSDHHNTRALAARQLDEMNLEAKEFTTALIRAVDRRDLAARVGLVEALATAHATRKSALDVLKESTTKNGDATKQAYAKAALRAVTTP